MHEINGMKCTILPDDPTIHDIAAAAVLHLRDAYKTSYNYDVDYIRRYTGKKFTGSAQQRHSLYQAAAYASHLFSQYRKREGAMEGFAKDEFEYADNKGWLCTYLSVLIAAILYEDAAFYTNEISLVQGFYKHALRPDFPDFVPFSKLQTGVHCFLYVGETVVDIGIGSQELFYDFHADPCFVGEVPQSMELYGFLESFPTIKEYARHFSGAAGKTYYDWIGNHRAFERKTIRELVKERKGAK